MIKFKFKLKDKTIEATVPEGWHEVTLGHVLSLEQEWSGDSGDMVGLLAAFTGCNYEEISNAKGDLWEPLFQVLSFVFNAPKWDKLKKPDLVTLKGKKIRPPKKLELEAFGQKVMAMKLISDEKKQHISNIGNILCIYLQPAYDGIFNSTRVAELENDVRQMSALEAMPYGIFFLKRYLRSKNYGRLGLKVSQRTLKNLKYIQSQVVTSSPSLTT